MIVFVAGGVLAKRAAALGRGSMYSASVSAAALSANGSAGHDRAGGWDDARRVFTMGTCTARIEGLRWRIVTGVGGAWDEAAAVRAARMERDAAPRARLGVYETLGVLEKDAWMCVGPPAPEMLAKLGPPNAPWMLWMRWAGVASAMVQGRER